MNSLIVHEWGEASGPTIWSNQKVPPRVLIARSPHQASALADTLRAHGIEPILIPAIELAPPTTLTSLDEALAQLDHFHWLLFTSANAVESFSQRLQSPNPYSLIPNPCRVAAIGPATATALELIGIKPTLLPPKAVAESLAETLLPHALQPNGTPTRFLLVRAEEARDHLPNTLRAAGAEVIIAPAYRTILPASSVPAIQTLFATPATYPDAITFTSSSTATNLIALLEAAHLILPPEILRVSIGPITSQTLREHSLPPHGESAVPSTASLAEKLLEMLRLK
jgi:uroporphyrinogen-III synthase